MAEAQIDEMVLTQKDQLTALDCVPISEPYIGLMTQVLTEHGAALTETRHYPNFGQPYKEYAIAFPAGTVRSFGLTMQRSRYFVITFPDGFHLRGGEMWPLQLGDRDRMTTILHLPDESGKKEGQERA